MLKPHSSKSNTRGERVNTAILITAMNADKETITGLDLLTKQEKTFSLHTPKPAQAARYAERPTIKTLIEGFKVGRNEYILEEGGIVAFEGAYESNGENLAVWPTVLAYNEADASQYVAQEQHAVLSMFTGKGRSSGTVYAYDESAVASGDLSGVVDASAAFFQNATVATSNQGNSTIGASFLVRGLDGEGKVVSVMNFGRNSVQQEDETYRIMTEAEFKEAMTKAISDDAALANASSFSVVPAKRYTVSPKALNAGAGERSSLPTFNISSYSFNERYQDAVITSSRPIGMKLSEEGDFVSSLLVLGKERSDPALLGGLEYDNTNKAAIASVEASGPYVAGASSSSPATNDAPQQEGQKQDKADPFAGAPTDEGQEPS